MLSKLFSSRTSLYSIKNFYYNHTSNLHYSSSSSTNGDQYRICIVGSGPSGFYTAQRLLKLNKKVTVDIIEKLPTPFGLIRYGVAPDHPEVKNVISSFTKLLKEGRCSFYGNISVGKDVTISTLQSNYSAVVLAYGAAVDKTLGVPGEDAGGFLSARRFVGWYNGLPEDSELQPNLDSHTALIIGHGNVSIDVARILLSPITLLENTDICSHALEVLLQSKVKHVIMIGRRGPLQVAFTIKELRELIKLEGVNPKFDKEDHVFLTDIVHNFPRTTKRLMELLLQTSLKGLPNKEVTKNRTIQLKYLRSPVSINTNESGFMKSITFEINRLTNFNSVDSKVESTGQFETIACSLAFRSIGYKSIPIIDGLPFDNKKNIILNKHGRVITANGQLIDGLYCSGWIKRGPVGVIVSTLNDASETAECIHGDIEANKLRPYTSSIIDILPTGHKIVTMSDWTNIDAEETERGENLGKPREKIVSVNEMIDVMRDKKSI